MNVLIAHSWNELCGQTAWFGISGKYVGLREFCFFTGALGKVSAPESCVKQNYRRLFYMKRNKD